MDNQYIKKLIAEVVASIQGCKATELPTEISKQLSESDRRSVFDGNWELPELLQEMIAEKMLVEVEYVIPNMNYRIKSFLLPAGTEIIKTIYQPWICEVNNG